MEKTMFTKRFTLFLKGVLTIGAIMYGIFCVTWVEGCFVFRHFKVFVHLTCFFLHFWFNVFAFFSNFCWDLYPFKYVRDLINYSGITHHSSFTLDKLCMEESVLFSEISSYQRYSDSVGLDSCKYLHCFYRILIFYWIHSFELSSRVKNLYAFVFSCFFFLIVLRNTIRDTAADLKPPFLVSLGHPTPFYTPLL